MEKGLLYTQIVVLVPSDRVRTWVPRLITALQSQFDLPTGLFRLAGNVLSQSPLRSEALERTLLGRHSNENADWISTIQAPLANDISWSDCLVVNATEHDPHNLPAETRAATILSPVFQGAFAIEGLIVPLLRWQTPHLGVVVTRDNQTYLLHGAYFVAIDLIPRALDTTLARMIILIRGAVDHLITDKPLPKPSPLPSPGAAPAALDFWSSRLLNTYLPRVGREIRKRFTRPEDWCIGYRRIGTAGEPSEDDLDPATFSLIEFGSGTFLC